MNRLLKYVYFMICLLVGTAVYAQQEKPKKIQVNGYIKDLQSASFTDNAASLTTSNLIHNRINMLGNWSEHFTTRLEFRNRIFYGEQVKLINGFGKLINTDAGYVNLGHLWVNEPSIVVHSIIDRALIRYATSKSIITIGRQRINWGINTIWNPNDLFNTYNFLDFDYEERPGVDAMRLQYFPEKIAAYELAYKPAGNGSFGVLAAMLKFNTNEYDLQVVGGVYYNDLALGMGWAGPFMQAGFKGEATYFRNRQNKIWGNDVINVSASFDYTFANTWYVSAATLYQSNPPVFLPATGILFNSNLSAKNLMPYRYTYLANVMKSFNPLFSGSVSVIYSPEKNNLILFPSVRYSLSSNTEIDLTMQSYFGETGNVYKSLGNSVYLRLKANF